jgi:hypothetical protein
MAFAVSNGKRRPEAIRSWPKELRAFAAACVASIEKRYLWDNRQI